jgi:hypothetical protein
MDINHLTVEELKIVKDAITQRINELSGKTSQQETLEEYAERLAKAEDFDNYKSLMQLVIDGANFQSKKLYSEKDLEQAFSSGRTVKNYKGEWEETYSDEMTSSKYENFKKWFEQFKNK